MRNRIIFHRESFDEEGYFRDVATHAILWIKAEWGEHVSSMANIMRNPSCVGVPKGQ